MVVHASSVSIIRFSKSSRDSPVPNGPKPSLAIAAAFSLAMRSINCAFKFWFGVSINDSE